MPRYLTPSKICLLTLISVYCHDITPPEATLPILTFISKRLIGNIHLPTQNATGSTSGSDIELSLTLKEFELFLSSLPNSNDGTPLLDWYNTYLWNARSIDAFFIIFEELDLLFLSKDGIDEWCQKQRQPKQNIAVPRITLSSTSLLGIFVRRAKVEFERLQFSDVIELWNDFVAYRGQDDPRTRDTDYDVQSTQRSLEYADWKSGGRIFKMISSGSHSGGRKDERLSTADVGHLLEFQIDTMQKLGTRIPDIVKERLWQLIGQSAENPSLAHYARFLDDWYAGDYASSFENLHRFYDYTMNKDRSNYQYALLNMAILQADFGCLSEAVAAMDECIATARENKDFPCLNFSLSWLYHFRHIHPGQMDDEAGQSMFGSERKGLAFLKEKAKESKMWSVLSSTLLNEAKLSLSEGHKPREAFERIYESSHLNVQHQIFGVQSAQLLIQSSTFSRLGMANLADSYCQLVLDCYDQSAPREEILRALCRKAYALALLGNYDEAFEVLQKLEPAMLRTLKFRQFLSIFKGMLKLKRCLHNEDLQTAERLIASLCVAPGADPELTFQIAMLEVDYLVRRGSFAKAFEKIEDLADEREKQDADVHQRIRLLVAKAILFAKCGRPQKGLTLALRATTAAYQCKIIPALWEAVGTLALVLISINQFHTAAQLLNSVIPQASETQDHGLQAYLCSVAADALVGKASREDADTACSTILTEALNYLLTAEKLYQSIEDIKGECEMLAKQALLAGLQSNEKKAFQLKQEQTKRREVWKSRIGETRVVAEPGTPEL